MTRSLHDLRHDALAIVRAGIRAADARVLTARALADAHEDWSPREGFSGATYVLAAGKAADAMAAAAAAAFGESIRGGLIVSSAGDAPAPRGFDRIVGGHPIPTEASEAAGRRALAIAQSLGPGDQLLVLLSGGASALMAVPADGITLDDKRRTTSLLLRAGADIHALNTVRKHLSAIKGGQLAASTAGSSRALVISDVIGDDLSVIASGPTVPDTSRFGDALELIQTFEPRSGGEFPAAVKARLADGANGRIADTPKPGDPRLARARTRVIGSRRDAMDGAVADAGTRGYAVVRVDDPVTGEARTAAQAHLRAALHLAQRMARPMCIVSSGETTVHVTGGGTGGRNQEFVLAAAEILSQYETAAVVASAGTDGIDGPTDAAGACADPTTIDRALADGLNPDHFLNDNNSYAFFDALGDLIHTGPTGTNVGDLQVILLA